MAHDNKPRVVTDAATAQALPSDSLVRSDDVPDLTDPGLYINRELSWLAFNERVLVHAQDDAHPLLERVKFLAIAANNLDEFFMIRVATLTRQHRAGVNSRSPDGLTIEQQLGAVRPRAERMLYMIARCWHDELLPLLATAGIHFLDRSQYTPDVAKYLATYFSANVYPALTPLELQPDHRPDLYRPGPIYRG